MNTQHPVLWVNLAKMSAVCKSPTKKSCCHEGYKVQFFMKAFQKGVD